MKLSSLYQYTILCEDRQTESFIKHFLEHQGINQHRIRTIISVSGIGSGEAFVRREYPKHLSTLRAANYNRRTLLVCTDADNYSIEERRNLLQQACKENAPEIPVRTTKEPVIQWIPKRNIETWIRFFSDMKEETDEETDYKHGTPVPCKKEAAKMSEFLQDQDNQPEDYLSSLIDAKAEYTNVCKIQA